MPLSLYRIGTGALALWFGVCCVVFTPAGRVALAQDSIPDAPVEEQPAAVEPETVPDAPADTPVEATAEPEAAAQPATPPAEAPKAEDAQEAEPGLSPLRQAPAPEEAARAASPAAAPAAPATQPEPPAATPEKSGETQGAGDFMKKMFAPGEKKDEPDRFDLDYAPSKPAPEGEKTPIYKNWILWTVVGVVAFAGTILIIQYGVDNSDNLSLNVTRRTP